MLVETADKALLRGPGYPVGSKLLRVYADVEPHTHEFCELAVLVAGRCGYRTRHRSVELVAGSVTVVRPGDWHAYDIDDPVDVFNLYVGTELLTREFSWVREHPQLVELWWRGGELDEPLTPPALQRVIGWMKQIQERRRAEERIGAVQLRSLLDCVLCELVPAASLGGQGGIADRGLSEPVMGVLAMMEDDPARAWSVTDLAGAVAVSPSHLHRLFRQELGSSPVAWLSRTRAEQMATQLTSGRESVGAIGAAVGWDDPNYAARRFRAVFGISPSAYRARYAVR